MDYGRTLIRKTYSLDETDKVPWVPFVGCHGGKLINLNAEEYLKSSANLVEGVSKAIELYNPDGIPILFDLQVEAEILGCKLLWSKENPPSVISHPLLEGKEIESLNIPKITEGRIPIILSAAKELREKYSDIALYGLITGPFTLSLHLLGTNIFLELFENPNHVKKIMDFTSQVSMQMANFYIDCGCDVIAVVDPMTSQIDADSFKQFIQDPISQIFNHIRRKDSLSSFFVCGNAYHNLEAMCQCGPNNISIDENIPLDYAKDVALDNNISFGGNLKLTSVLLLGSEDDCKKHTVETLDTGGSKGFVLSPGCDLPMATPKENLIATGQMVNDSYQQEIVRNLGKHLEDTEILDLSNYYKKDRVTIDVITLDSGSCSPCQYMMEAVEQASKSFSDKIQFKEHKIKEIAGLKMMATLGVKNLPSICINGTVEFSSRIPAKNELEKRINSYLKN